MGAGAQPPDLSGPVLISACLAGRACRFDGSSNQDDQVSRLVAEGAPSSSARRWTGATALLGPPPRSSEATARTCSREGPEWTEQGRDVTDSYLEGARRALEACESSGARVAILKARSPSCGMGSIYDGTFSRRLVAGDGVTAALLREHGIEVLTEEELGPE
jgi:uncharacterized protein YbbK (DUF523 family)